ncbi:MAG: glycosyltransferase family 2 protein [Bacillota bacterium]
MEPLVSIIVPVYNGEKYLEKCIKSILSQTLSEIELIIIDDCSTDNTREVIEKFTFDPRVKPIYNHKNLHVSASRNIGLRAAIGEYIAFVDSDDYIATEMLEKLYVKAKKFEVDIVTSGYIKVDDEENEINTVRTEFVSDRYLDFTSVRKYLSKAHELRVMWFIWRNIYRRTLIHDNNLFFNEEIKLGEDTIFNFYAFYYAKGVVASNENFYYYRDTPNSLTSLTGKKYLEENATRQYEEYMNYYKKFDFEKDAHKDFSYYFVGHIFPRMLLNSTLIYKKELRNELKRILELDMVKNSLENISFFSNRIPRGIKFVAFLSKYKLVAILKYFYLSKN